MSWDTEEEFERTIVNRMYGGRLAAARAVPYTSSKTARLELNPHYSDSRFSSGRVHTVWVAQGHRPESDGFGTETVKGAFYNYDDRLRQAFGWDESQAAWDAARAETEPGTATFIELYLRKLTADPKLRLLHILAGVNVSNGYAYNVYGYVEDPKPQPAEETP